MTMLSRTDLTTLIEATPKIAVSLYMPMETVGRETRQNPIRLKNLLKEARDELSVQDVSETEIDALLAPAVELIDDNDFWQYRSPGLALFLTDAGMQQIDLPEAVPEMASVSAGFHITPLVPFQEKDAVFVILSISAATVRVWQASRFEITAMKVPDMPASIEALDEEPDYEGNVQSHGYGRPYSGGKNMPKTQVYGDSPEEWRKGRLLEYARRIAMALSAHLARDPLSIVVVADAEIGGHVLQHQAIAPLIAGFVEINSDSLDEAGLLDVASEVMQPIRDETLDAAIEQVDAAIGRGDGCIDPGELGIAAEGGRIDQLFLAEPAAVAAGDDLDDTTLAAELVRRDARERVVQLTLRSGGKIWVVAPDRLPDGVSIAATLRY